MGATYFRKIASPGTEEVATHFFIVSAALLKLARQIDGRALLVLLEEHHQRLLIIEVAVRRISPKVRGVLLSKIGGPVVMGLREDIVWLCFQVSALSLEFFQIQLVGIALKGGVTSELGD